MPTYSHVYQSLQEMLACCDAGYQAGRVSHTVLEGRSDFIGRSFSGWDDIKAQAGKDWQTGLDIFQELLFKLSKVALPEVTSARRRPRWSEDGDELDNDRLRAGQDDCWRTTSRQNCQAPRTITILTNISTAGSRDSDEVLWRGALAVVLADLLEKAGHRVELWAVDKGEHVYENDFSSFQAVCLKRADQPLDLSLVVNAVSGWFYRTVFFQDLASEPRNPVTGGFGRPRPINPRSEEIQSITGGQPAIVIDNVWNLREAVAHAARVIATLNS